MDIITVVVAVLCAGLGLLAGQALGRQRTAAQHTAALAEAVEQTHAARRDAALAQARLEAERAGAEQRLTDLRRSEEQLKDALASTGQQVLAANSKQFLELATQTLRTAQTETRADLDQRRQAVEALVAPLTEHLATVQAHVHDLEVKREGAYQGLLAQIGDVRRSSEQLRTETASLVTALRKPQARGRWGEMQLRRTVELAGMVERCDFDEQVSGSDDDGGIRPDLVVHLPGGKHVVVDSKCALDGFLELSDALDEAAHKAALSRHARHVRSHIDGLAKKSYGVRVAGSPEFVVMFLPGEALLSAALDGSPDLIEYGAERSVIIATPTTLIALLRTVSFTWRQDSLARDAREIAELGGELYKRLCDMGGHVAKIGRGLESAVKSYNDAVGNLESRVLVTARKLADHGVRAGDLLEPKQVDVSTRALQKAELVESAASSRPVKALPPGEAMFELDSDLRRAAGLD